MVGCSRARRRAEDAGSSRHEMVRGCRRMSEEGGAEMGQEGGGKGGCPGGSH